MIFILYKRIVVDEDDKGEFRVQRVKSGGKSRYKLFSGSLCRRQTTFRYRPSALHKKIVKRGIFNNPSFFNKWTWNWIWRPILIPNPSPHNANMGQLAHDQKVDFLQFQCERFCGQHKMRAVAQHTNII